MRSLSRRDRIEVLLRTYRDAAETLQRREGGGKTPPDSRVLSMSRVWHAGCPKDCRAGTCRSSYAELLRSLARLRDENPSLYWHVKERYLRSTRATRRGIVKQGEHYEGVRENELVISAVYLPGSGYWSKPGDAKKPKVLVDAIVERWDAKVDLEKVGRALDRLSTLFAGEPYLADEVFWNVAA